VRVVENVWQERNKKIFQKFTFEKIAIIMSLTFRKRRIALKYRGR
jgi:hypothetical protein